MAVKNVKWFITLFAVKKQVNSGILLTFCFYFSLDLCPRDYVIHTQDESSLLSYTSLEIPKQCTQKYVSQVISNLVKSTKKTAIMPSVSFLVSSRSFQHGYICVSIKLNKLASKDVTSSESSGLASSCHEIGSINKITGFCYIWENQADLAFIYISYHTTLR